MIEVSERTRVGRAIAIVWTIIPPIDTPTTWADSQPRWSIRPNASSAMSSSVYGGRPPRPRNDRTSWVRVTRPESRLDLPVSRLSKRTTWNPASASIVHSSGSHQFIGPPRPITSSSGSPSELPKVW